jgi:copper oxidase (laccase) domain-containing protein
MDHFPSNVKILSTQRFIEGGKGSGNFENFNLALHVNDNQESVLENRKILKSFYDLPSEPQWINQVHSSKCIDATNITQLLRQMQVYL